MNLAMLKPGDRAAVVALGAERVLKRRLMDMGVLAGVELSVERVAPLGDPIEVSVRGYNLSLRKSEAQSISVRRLP